MRRPISLVTAAVFFVALSVATLSSQQPSFRSSIELLAIDVTVVDAKGTAVRDLTPDDFIVEVAGHRRRVVRSDFIDFSERETAPAPDAAPAHVRANQANRHAADPRLILLLVDDESFTLVEGTRVFLQLAGAIEHAFPGDALAFAPVSGQSSKVEFTTDRRPVVDALRNLQGRFVYAGSKTDLGIREALQIYRGDSFVLERAVLRECSAMSTYTSMSRSEAAGNPCRLAILFDSKAIAADVHARTQRTLRSVARQLEALGTVPGVKYLLLVSQGIYLDEDIGVSEELARVAAAASVTLQVLHIDRQDPGDVTRARPSPKSSEDSVSRKTGLETVAAAAGGNVENAIIEPTLAFDRIRTRIATVYRLGVESAPDDASGGTRPIKVSTTRPGLVVRTHRQVVVPDRAAGANPKTRLERALASPLLDRGIGMRMSVFGYRSADGGGNIIVSAEADANAQGLRLAYVVRNTAGVAVVASEVAPDGITVTENLPPLVVFRTTAPLDDYTVKLAAVDADGRIGSVTQSVSLPRAGTPGFAVGDVMVLPDGADVLHSRPSARIPAADRAASVYFEVYSGGPAPATTAVVVMEITDAQSGASQGSKREELSLKKAAGYSAAAARVGFSPAMLLPGDYVVRVSVEGTKVSASRQFTIE